MALLGALKERARQLKTEVLALVLAARHPRTPWYAKLFLVAIVAYALSPIDLIPDFIPVLGLVDDIILLPFAIALAVKMVPADVMAECRALAAERRPDGSRSGRIGAAIVVLIWLALIVFAAMWAHNTFAHERGRGMDDRPCADHACGAAQGLNARMSPPPLPTGPSHRHNACVRIQSARR